MEVLINYVPEVKRWVEQVVNEPLIKFITDIRPQFKELNSLANRFGYRMVELQVMMKRDGNLTKRKQPVKLGSTPCLHTRLLQA